MKKSVAGFSIDLYKAEKASINRTLGIARMYMEDTQDLDQRWALINSAQSQINGIRLLATNLCIHDEELHEYAWRELENMREYYCGEKPSC